MSIANGNTGSPPRVRGALVQRPHRRAQRRITPCVRRGRQHVALTSGAFRITPACTGSTRCPRCPGATPSDHPRACGEAPTGAPAGGHKSDHPCVCEEHLNLQFKRQHQIGSPHVRGASLHCLHLLRQAGHSRACGEHTVGGSPFRNISGSHQRMRGAPLTWWFTASGPADHPAHTGNALIRLSSVSISSGSPPRIGGMQHRCEGHRAELRITPAGARSNEPVKSRRLEDLRITPARVRGAQRRVPPVHHCVRITPARAGNTHSPAHSSSPTRDHPRVCGEDSQIGLPTVSVIGTPPRVRGAHLGRWR